ncbi:MAG: MFS transporter [Polaromonas sp.]
MNPQLPRSRFFLYGLIASLTFGDFLQTGLVAFSAAPIMGDISASPEEYSVVATLYAVVAIGMIALQRQLVEMLGWRKLVQVSALLFAAGTAGCGLSHSLAGFAISRIVMALGCASFMTAARLLVNHIPPSPRRFTGIKFLASGLAWGVAMGPLLGSFALGSQGWRLGFWVMLVPALVIALLAQQALDDAPAPQRQAKMIPAQGLAGAVVLMGASFLVLHALQRTGFDYFSEPLHLGLVACLAVPAGMLFWRLNRQAHRPLIGFAALAQRRYLVGMTIFGSAYVVLGANNTMLPVLLQRALGMPLESAGRYLGMGALAGVATFIALARLLPRYPAPTPYYLAGFSALMLCGWQLGRLGEGADVMQVVMPALLCNASFVIAVLATTAMQTFQTLQHDEAVFSHANQVKNMLSQFGIAAGVALATLVTQWRSTVHYVQLGESLSPSSLALQSTLDTLTRFFASTHDPAAAPRLALVQVAQLLNQEATLMGVLDYFVALRWFAAGCLVLVVGEMFWRTVLAKRLKATAQEPTQA